MSTSSITPQSCLLRLATFNIRNTTDRYEERLPYLQKAIADINADIIGFQEVNFVGGQVEMIAQAMGVDPASAFAGALPYAYPFKPEDPSFRIDGNLIICRPSVGQVVKHDVVNLSDHRIAHRIVVRLRSSGRLLSFVNTHMHHELFDSDVRAQQAQRILEWVAVLDSAEQIEYSVIAGDFNTPPTEPAYGLMVGQGYSSMYKFAHGEEPERTFPSGLQATTMDTDPPLTLDYVWVKSYTQGAPYSVDGAFLAANRPSPLDDTIYPSDHIAVGARVWLH